MRLSVCIITKNEESKLPRCLKSVQPIADEIIIVDDYSSDQTVEIANTYGAKVYVRKLDTFSNQKNYAASHAKGEWIFQIDADEEITRELANEIHSLLLRDNNFPIKSKKGLIHNLGQINGFLIPRRNIILGAEIKHTRWSPDKHIWLWRRGKGKWFGDIHEEVHVEGWVGELSHAKIHYQYETVTDFFSMLNNYTTREAEEKVKKGIHFTYFQLFYAPLLSFFRRYIYKRGFLDGWRGFTLSYLMAIYRMTTWIKVWERKQNGLVRK